MPRASPFFRPALIFTALLLASSFALRVLPLAAESAHSVPPPALDTPANPQATSEVAILAGGCFWGVQGVFQHVQGVTSAVSGYTGGAADTAHHDRALSWLVVFANWRCAPPYVRGSCWSQPSCRAPASPRRYICRSSQGPGPAAEATEDSDVAG